MTAKEYLEQYRTAFLKADRLRRRLDQLRSDYDSVRGGIIHVSHVSCVSKPTEEKVERVQEALELWANAQLDAVEIRQHIFDVINAIPDSDISDLLWYRYLGLFTWEDIEGVMELSHSHVFKLHRKGLAIVGELIN